MRFSLLGMFCVLTFAVSYLALAALLPWIVGDSEGWSSYVRESTSLELALVIVVSIPLLATASTIHGLLLERWLRKKLNKPK